MVKKITKELIILILLIIAIVLLLGVILYDYIPSNKIIPEDVSYTTPESLEEEIKDAKIDEQTDNPLVYTVTEDDLTNYKRIQEYVPGRKNPFSSINELQQDGNTVTTDGNTTTSTQQTNTTSSSNQQNANGTNTTTSSNSTQDSGYLPNKGTK